MKYTAILEFSQEDEVYLVRVPAFPEVHTYGEDVQKATDNAKEAIELVLEVEAEQGADPVPPNAHVSHVVVGEIEAEVPESLIESEEEAAHTAG